MKFTLAWLKDHIETDDTAERIADTLTRIGLEVEGLDDPAAKLKDFIIASVIEAKQHPNADRLRVCMVDTGTGEPVQVVCGAPNARTGMKSVFSPAGTYIPGKDITLGKGVIRGVESNGMLCSAAELQLSEDHDGIIDLPDDAPVGAPYVDWLAASGMTALDPVIEINLTPNRPDCTSIHGIARDLAAAGTGKLKGGKLKGGEPKGIHGQFDCPVQVKLDLPPEQAFLAPAFALRLVRGVKNGPSPAWMQARLKAIGLRPINALVDITNYMTFDRGRPLHVFDADKVKGNLNVRRAANGEQVVGLDGKTYLLDAAMIVIADDNGVESIAGIMGGEASGCDENTVNVLIESALWDAPNIAQTGRKLGIITDARYRFERGVDPAFMIPGCELATQMVMDLCGGAPSHLVIAGEVPTHDHIIDFPWSETRRLSGLDLRPSEQKAVLNALGFWVSGKDDHVKVAPPSWRPDVTGKADLVEEIIRITGLERITPQPFPPQTAVHGPVLTLLQKRTRMAKRALAGRGMMEAVTWSFISAPQAKLFGRSDAVAPLLRLANPIAADLSDMRPSLLPGLLTAAQRNVDRGTSDLALFEVGQIFLGDGENDQKIVATGVRRGFAAVAGNGRHWSGSAAADVFDAKADAMALLASLGVPTGGLQVVEGGPSFMHPGRSAALQFGPNGAIGCFGELHPATLKALGVDGPIVGFEIMLDALPAPKTKPTKMKPKLELSTLQPLVRDFAFVADQSVRADDVLKAARGAERTLISDVRLFDVYEGKGVEPGRKSLGVEVTLAPKDKTLTDSEIEAVSAKIVAEVAKKTGANLRS